MDLQTVTEFVLQNFDKITISNNGSHFLARCVLCGDSKKNPYKKRFNLDYNNGVPGWHCWNCGRSGNFIEIYSIVKGISYDDAKKELFKYDGNEVKRQMAVYRKRPEICEKVKKEENNFNWIIGDCFKRLNSIPENFGILENEYLKRLDEFYEDRKISSKYKIYAAYKGRYKGRIIIPIFDNNRNIIYFQARRMPGTKIEPKYDNPISPKELCILNKHLFNENKSIIVTEGLIDSFTVGNQGTSCLGKEISEDLLLELFSLTNKDIIIALDNDKEAYKALRRFMNKNKYAMKVKYFLYPKEFEGCDDINTYVRKKENSISVYDLILNNSVNYSTAYTKLSISKLLEKGK